MQSANYTLSFDSRAVWHGICRSSGASTSPLCGAKRLWCCFVACFLLYVYCIVHILPKHATK